MARTPPCCCCFVNNVRHLILLLTIFSISSLFANLVLFNFTAILDKDLQDDWKPVASLTSLHEYSIWHNRRRRDINETVFDKWKDGHPLLPKTKRPSTRRTTTTTTTTELPTTKRLVFFTNSPTDAPFLESTKHPITRRIRATTASSKTTTEIHTTTIVPTTTADVVLEEVRKAIEKYEHPDKDETRKPQKEDDYGSKTNGKDSNVEPVSIAKLNMTKYLVRTMIYAAPGVGILIGIFPSVLMIRAIGVRVPFAAALGLSAVCMVISPFTVSMNSLAIAISRFILGFCFSMVFPMVGHMIANWGTLKEQLFFLTSTFLFITIGPALSWPLTMLLHSNEVDLIFIYILHSVPTFLLAIIFLIFYRDYPQDHPWVNGLELNKIVAGKVKDMRKNRVMDTPCCTLLRSVSAYSIWVSAFGLFLVLSLFIQYIPSFLSCQQVFMVDYMGTYGILPYLGIPIVFIISGFLNKISMTSRTILIRIFNTMSFILTGLFVLALPILFYADKTGFARISLFLSLAPLGFTASGFLRSTILVGRAYSKYIITFYGVSFGLAFLLMPCIVGSLVLENALKEWLRIFLVTSAILLVCAIVFAVFGRGNSAGWAESSWDPLVSTKMLDLHLIDRSQDESGLIGMKLIGPSKL
ncbi:unnamed protein product [Auanema sp. JU1783]|nr:unnamed protein product [Auanema sp. JU1783]